MLRYFFKRLMFLVPVLFGVSILIFSIVHLAPGDPAEVMLGPSATQEEITNLRSSSDSTSHYTSSTEFFSPTPSRATSGGPSRAMPRWWTRFWSVFPPR